ncbi:Demethylmenaquinone methyltransferase [Thermoflexales bacterium]|nr:Demethylmenaquinone methyltransferase [Thermoflexales bacterium]
MIDYTEMIPCLLCGADRPVRIYDAPDRLMKIPGEFRIVRCGSCGLVYLSPRPTVAAIGSYYPEAYEPYLRITPQSLPAWRRWLLNYGLRKRIRPIVQRKAPGRALDIGCATGQFLAYLRDTAHWQVTGVEPGQNAARYARETFGLEVYHGDLRSAQFADATFDAVTMWDVLEHLHDPCAELREIRRVLRPEGLLVLRVPSLDSLDARIFGPYWAGLDVPRHMVVFSRRALMQMLGQAGFIPERMWCASGSYFAFMLSWRMLVEDKVAAPRSQRVLDRLVNNVVLRALSTPYFWLVDQLGRGASLTVIARPVEQVS